MLGKYLFCKNSVSFLGHIYAIIVYNFYKSNHINIDKISCATITESSLNWNML